MSFVGRSGTGLTLNGKPWRFLGFNVPYDMSNAKYESLAAALPLWPKTANAARSWAFQNLFVVNGKLDWTAMDQLMALYQNHGVYVILALGNQYNWHDGATKDLSWYQSGYKSVVQPGEVVPYREWVAEIVTRYSKHPNVLSWQFVNEAQAPGGTEQQACSALAAFAEDIGALTNGLDPNHLFNLGNCCGWGGAGKQFAGSVGPDYQTLLTSSRLDWGDVHDYGYPSLPWGSTPGVAQALAAGKALNKPTIVGESGIDWTASGAGNNGHPISPPTTSERATLFRGKFQAWFKAGMAGALLWYWTTDPNPGDGTPGYGYAIGPGDPVLPMMNPALY